MPHLIRPHGPIATPEVKAQTFRQTLLGRFSPQDDIPISAPSVASSDLSHPPIVVEGIFRAYYRVSSTTPGPDEITSNYLRRAWPVIVNRVSALFRQYEKLGIHPLTFKKSEKIILPKVGNRDFALPKSYSPIDRSLYLHH